MEIEENYCEGCESLFDYELDEDNFCEECHIQAGIDRVESIRDALD
jgi:rRNA maturation endonuclease Nob1